MPITLEALGDEEIAEVGMVAWEEYADILSEQMSVRNDAYEKEQWQKYLRKAISQATIAHNEKQGQLYRVKE